MSNLLCSSLRICTALFLLNSGGTVITEAVQSVPLDKTFNNHNNPMSLISYIKGDLFQITISAREAAKRPIILAHACNCRGVWGGGIAYVFKQRFPSAFSQYNAHCNQYSVLPSKLLGTALLVPVNGNDVGFVPGIGEDILIACLFTSDVGDDSPEEIAHYTELAMLDLRKQLENPKLIQDRRAQAVLQRNKDKDFLINMPKINAGIFAVPWGLTEKALKKSGLGCRVFEL
ncbi:unnamed protein product [Ambrosiozyma monospora]|uniref:Unnamed protein product n=1 Tax=Ambrosiozyma monospora TaxID=43982 RepID=A0ACB5U2L6_AMBMO|nr:unnamed protein product [Ambrosiozyma monospora]